MNEKLKAIESGKSDPNKLMVVLQKTLSNITYNQIQNDPEIKAITDTEELTQNEVKAIVEEEIKKDDYNNEKIKEKIIDKLGNTRNTGLRFIRDNIKKISWPDDTKTIDKIMNRIDLIAESESDKKQLIDKYQFEINQKLKEFKPIEKIEEPKIIEDPSGFETEQLKKPAKKKINLKKKKIEGNGLIYGNGISNFTINKIMDNFKDFGYLGCFPFEELENVYKKILKEKTKYFSFI